MRLAGAYYWESSLVLGVLGILGIGCVRIFIQLVYLHILVSGISSSLRVDVSQKLNHVNPWYSFVCVCLFIFKF